jgi:hypothetical protein
MTGSERKYTRSREPELRHQAVEQSFHDETDTADDEREPSGDDGGLPRDQRESTERDQYADETECSEFVEHTPRFVSPLKTPVVLRSRRVEWGDGC